MVRIFTRIKQLIAAVKMKFGRQSEQVAEALQSVTPGAALRASMHKNASNPKVVDELLNASRAHDLKGRP